MIKVENLTKSFGELEVLKGINQEIKDGEVVVVIGPSGSGKSTFLRCLNLLEEPTSGKIFVDDEEITSKDIDINKVREEMGMVFQSFNLFNNLNIIDNITLAPTLVKKMEKDQAEKKAMELLERVGLPDKRDSYPKSLSGGQKQRIAIARVFLKNPKVLILDEATSALDNTSERLIQESLEKLSQGRTTLTIAHRLTTIKNAKKIIVLTDDGIKESGTHDELMSKEDLYYKLYTGSLLDLK